ncbi:hypothetical protein PVMG_06118 [Plasmodium vivax Mauritania I]|uniref:Variable surface protein n=1 Tax=Plasmodium vivax Mauritania I TaxID=1035515 RepID=A0A0J9TJL5_PLAVI|nr:hypothetical protein PVMG_06118 [Plasmodium vivax Mauritania I]
MLFLTYNYLLFSKLYLNILLLQYFNTSLNEQGSVNGLCDKSRHRILTYTKLQKELKCEIAHGSEKNKLVKEQKKTSAHRKMKDDKSKYLEAYMNDYKNRYPKKKGLRKLDCYCENKIYERLAKIDKFAENVKNNRGILKKLSYKNYSVSLFLSCIIPLLVIILIALDQYDSANYKKYFLIKTSDIVSIIESLTFAFNICMITKWFISFFYVYVVLTFLFKLIFLLILNSHEFKINGYIYLFVSLWIINVLIIYYNKNNITLIFISYIFFTFYQESS